MVKIAGQIFAVTGGCGFIGRHLVRELVEEGAAQVRVFDKLMADEALRESLRSRPVTFYSGDVTSLDDLAPVMQGAAGLFHMAVLPLGPSNQDLRSALNINVLGTFNVLDAAHQGGVRKVVYSSASSVYGDTEAVMDESHPLDTRSMYGATKLAGELLLRAFGTHKGLEYVVLRYMNVYGPGQTGGLINAVINRLRQRQSPTVFGDGGQSFDFVHVLDVVQANVAAMSSSVSGEAFNIGGDEEYSVKDVIAMVQGVMGTNLEPEYRPAPSGDVRRRVGSSARAKEMLGYEPRVAFKEGLRQLVDGARQQKAAS